MHLKRWPLAGLTLAVALCLQAATPVPEDVSAVLQTQTQEMIDAIPTGSAAVWDRYLDPQATYTTKDGTVLTKAQMVEQTKPMAQGLSGNIKMTDFKVTVHGQVAIANYLDDEHENYHGHASHRRYRTTETWLKTPAGWRLIVGQILALRTDPPAVQLTPKQMDEYSGRYALTREISYESGARAKRSRA